MGRKKGKQSQGAGSKRGRAAQDRMRARDTRDDLKRLLPRPERPRTTQPTLSVRELLAALPRQIREALILHGPWRWRWPVH